MITQQKKIRQNIQALGLKITDIQNLAASEYRQLKSHEKDIINQMNDAIEDLKGEISDGPQTVYMENNKSENVPYALKSPRDSKKYHSLFGAKGFQWTDKRSDFFSAVFSGRYHPDLRNAMTESVPSDGGFLVPVEYAQQIFDVALEDSLVFPRCFVQPMTSNSIDIPAMDIGSHASSLFGGFTATHVAEAGSISSADPKTRKMSLNAKKLVGLLRMSSELAQDVPGGIDRIVRICGNGLSWYQDKFYLKGTGAGEPLGILNAGCTITVDKEGGQVADTIAYENLTSMLSRLWAGSFKNSLWICHQSTIPQLLSLSQAVGTGGSAVPVLNENNGQFTILTRPVVFTEKTEVLGNKGDIMLVDLSQYVVGLRHGITFDLDPYSLFTSDEIYAKIKLRHDGQPLWDEALTLEDGSTTVSPFVTLEAR